MAHETRLKHLGKRHQASFACSWHVLVFPYQTELLLHTLVGSIHTHLGQQLYEITHGIQSVLWYTQISPPATLSKDSASTPVVQEKKRGIKHQWCEGEGSVMNNGTSQCSVLSYVEGLLHSPHVLYILGFNSRDMSCMHVYALVNQQTNMT